MIIDYRPTQATEMRIKHSRKNKSGIDIVGNQARIYNEDEELKKTIEIYKPISEFSIFELSELLRENTIIMAGEN